MTFRPWSAEGATTMADPLDVGGAVLGGALLAGTLGGHRQRRPCPRLGGAVFAAGQCAARRLRGPSCGCRCRPGATSARSRPPARRRWRPADRRLGLAALAASQAAFWAAKVVKRRAARGRPDAPLPDVRPTRGRRGPRLHLRACRGRRSSLAATLAPGLPLAWRPVVVRRRRVRSAWPAAVRRRAPPARRRRRDRPRPHGRGHVPLGLPSPDRVRRPAAAHHIRACTVPDLRPTASRKPV